MIDIKKTLYLVQSDLVAAVFVRSASLDVNVNGHETLELKLSRLNASDKREHVPRNLELIEALIANELPRHLVQEIKAAIRLKREASK